MRKIFKGFTMYLMALFFIYFWLSVYNKTFQIYEWSNNSVYYFVTVYNLVCIGCGVGVWVFGSAKKIVKE